MSFHVLRHLFPERILRWEVCSVFYGEEGILERELFITGGSALPPPENNVRIWGYKGGETCYNNLYEHGDC